MFGATSILDGNYLEAREFLFDKGFVKIDSLLELDEIKKFEETCEFVKNKPTPFKIHRKDENGEFFMDFNNWRRFEKVYELCTNPKIVEVVKKLGNSQKCHLMHEDIIIKEGQQVQETPPHHDRPYFIAKGDINLSIWITSSGVSRDSSLLMYSGSHKEEKLYLPKTFLSGLDSDGYKGLSKDIFSPLDSTELSRFEEVDFEMKAGDAIVFFHKTLHGSRKHVSEQRRNSLVIRFLLDGATLTKKYYNNVPPYERMGLKIEEGLPIPETFFPNVG